MSLAERLKEVAAEAKPSIDLWFDGLDDDDRAAWVNACSDPRISTAVLMRIVKDEGVAVGKETMVAHRVAHGLAR